jgi:hypothetical protein
MSASGPDLDNTGTFLRVGAFFPPLLTQGLMSSQKVRQSMQKPIFTERLEFMNARFKYIFTIRGQDF